MSPIDKGFLWSLFAIFCVSLIWSSAVRLHDAGRCASAGGVLANSPSGYVCVKPIDLERN